MIKIGHYNTLTVLKENKTGFFLDGGDQEIYLSKKGLKKKLTTGIKVKVFVYNSSRDSLQATTQRPRGVVDDFAALKVKSVTGFGAFLDWGIPKDLFVPRKHQLDRLEVGQTVVVRLTLDYEKKGVIGSCRVEDYLQNEPEELKKGDSVNILVYELTQLGPRVIVEGKYKGLIFTRELHEELKIGQKKQAYISKIREDGKLDISLQPVDRNQALDAAKEKILTALEKNQGLLPLNDNSSPEDIRECLALSKKQFKEASGRLYKERKIIFSEKGLKKTD